MNHCRACEKLAHRLPRDRPVGVLSHALPPLLTVLVAFIVSAPAHAQIMVHKTAEPFESDRWAVSDDSSAGGSTRLAPDSPAEIRSVSSHSLQLDAVFSGTGFQAFSAEPPRPLVIPGVTRSLSLWVRSDGQDYEWNLNFTDGWGRTEAAGQKLQWPISHGVGTAWKKVTFTVPPGWIQPLTITSVLVHNWGSQTKKATARLWVDELEVDTDIAGVDPQTGNLRSWTPPDRSTPPGGSAQPAAAPITPLVTTELAGVQEHNVFSGVPPAFMLRVRNWKPDAVTGTLRWTLTDYLDKRIGQGSRPLRVEDNLSLPIPLGTLPYGVYRLNASVVWGSGTAVNSDQSLAIVPVPHTLTEEEKDRSPYGLNVLSARQAMVSTFRKAGIIWYRDYGFNYEWLVRARGADNSYSGWPWYPKIMKQYEASGVRVLADLQTAIKPPPSGAKPGPDLAWTQAVANIVLAFPSVSAFELDNEYDLNPDHIKAEAPIHWRNYLDYHRKFGEIVHLLASKQTLAVENGRAGIWPERARAAVQSGAFAPIDVVNSHYYSGAEPPELSVLNHNMGVGQGEKYLSFFDQLRAAKRAARSDGKDRQHWLTEFGWDTKAGPVVTPLQQAAYLARTYMMLLSAGTEKGFWFFDLDSPRANQFFDGCGLFTSDQMPKLSYAAYAGLTQLLPAPDYLGMINAGPGTCGYLFMNHGKIVASLWSITGDQRPTVSFGGAKLYDFLANPLDTGDVKLDVTPVYAVGLSRDSPWVRQAAYSLATPYLVAAAAGDGVTTVLHIQNDRTTPIMAAARLLLPEGWTSPQGKNPADLEVAPGKSKDVLLSFRVGVGEPLGERTVEVELGEGHWRYSIPLRVQVRLPMAMRVRGLSGEPGSSDVTIALTNLSAEPLSGVLHFRLPASWKTGFPTMRVPSVKPGAVREIHANVRWTTDWKPGESADVAFRTDRGQTIEQPLIPDRLVIHQAPDQPMNASEMNPIARNWPAANLIPDWVLGSTNGAPDGSVYLGWSKRGLYIAVNVHDSRARVPDPRSFWVGDALEIFIDTNQPTRARTFGRGAHQFWLVPQFEAGRVYVGRWKRGAEIKATRYDLPEIPSSARKTADGYFMKCLIPASMIDGFNPSTGARLGLNLNLTVEGIHFDREVFWPLPKSEGIADHPENWGEVTLEP